MVKFLILFLVAIFKTKFRNKQIEVLYFVLLIFLPLHFERDVRVLAAELMKSEFYQQSPPVVTQSNIARGRYLHA